MPPGKLFRKVRSSVIVVARYRVKFDHSSWVIMQPTDGNTVKGSQLTCCSS